MQASLRTVSRHTPYSKACRLMSSNVRFPSASGSHSMSDPQPGSSGGVPGGSSDQPTPGNINPGTNNQPDQQQQGSPPVPSAAASPPPPPPPPNDSSHPFAGAKEYAENQEAASKNAVVQSNLPALPQQSKNNNAQYMHNYTTPPFDTHRLFRALEKTFPEPIANSLMRATRALLVDRIGRVKREALSSKDLENQAYLFRAALSEARNEISLRQRNDSTALRTSLAALRRENDNLDGKMKSDIANLKHELQMDVDNRKTESKTDLKQMDIRIEEILNKAIVSIGEMRTATEQMKWENMYRAVMALGAFALAIVIIFEYNHAMKPPPPPAPPKEPKQQNTVLEGLEMQMT